ncbi:polyprenyl synthetase family protein [Reyranella sp. CPCC 100927]|nr:polyprenyl synthetase family protein [Reyranella sp. CPCC 100927]
MPLIDQPDIRSALDFTTLTVERAMDRLLPKGDDPEARLFEAMRYSALSGGKRLRAFFVMTGAALFGVSTQAAQRVAAAVEFVHAYSLIHDDLPAMDDDDFRRGQPSCHKRFDEATAILAGDALQSLAFEVLAHEDTHGDPSVRIQLISGLAQAIGPHGMVAGQMVDMDASGKTLSIGQITRLQRLKTGALISYACSAGALLGKASDPARHALVAYAHDVGLAFQIADDLLDVEGTHEEIGKTPGKDVVTGKATFVSLLGRGRARDQASLLADQAGRHLDMFGDKAELLRQAARYVVDRRR